MARRAIPTDASGLPDKPYFKIGEAARLCAVKPYVLRYWETEFKSLKPQKTRSQQRLYKRRDVELLVGALELVALAGDPPALLDSVGDAGPDLSQPVL